MPNIFLNQASFAAGELAPSLWGRQDLAKYNVGLRKCENFIIHPHGGVSKRQGLRFCAKCKYSNKAVRLVPFEYNLEQSYILEFGDYYVRFYKDGALVTTTSGAAYEIATPYPASALANLKYVQSADVLFLTHPSYPPYELTRYSDTSWTLTKFDFKYGPFITKAASLSNIKITPSATSGSITLTASAALFNSGHVGSVWKITNDIASSAKTFNTAGTTEIIYVYKQWQIETGGFWKGTINLLKLNSETGKFETVDSFYSAANTSNGKNFSSSGEVDELTQFRLQLVDWDNSVPEGNRNTEKGYVRFKTLETTNTGYMKITSVSSSTVATATVTKALASTLATTMWEEGAWSSYRGWPSVAAFHQERMVFANTKSEPQTFWASQSGDYNNFETTDESLDDEAVSAALVSRKVSGIRHFVNLSSLIGFTADSEWQINNASEILKPSNMNPRPQGYRGSSNALPIVVGNTVIFCQEQGCRLRSLGYDFASDSYTGSDLTVMANHLFEKYDVADMCFQQEPDSMAWVVRSDGALCSLTFLQEHEVIAWARHPLGANAKALACASVSTSDYDEVYFAVERNGVRSVERLVTLPVTTAAEGVYLDGCVKVSGTSKTQTVSGLSHLEGLTVTALVDGDVEENLTVSGGAVTLKYAGKTVCVGVPYTSLLETLDLALQRQDGTQMSRRARVSAVSVRVQETRGLFCSTQTGEFEEANERSNENYDTAINLLTDDIKFHVASTYDNARVTVKAPYPLPCSVLAIMPVVDAAGTI